MFGGIEIIVVIIVALIIAGLIKSNHIESANNNTMNKVINVTLTGGIIGLFIDSPQNKLNRVIQKENNSGWEVLEIIPAASGNVFLIVIRIIILIITLFLYTPTNGYYLVMKKINNRSLIQKNNQPSENLAEQRQIETPNTQNLFK